MYKMLKGFITITMRFNNHICAKTNGALVKLLKNVIHQVGYLYPKHVPNFAQLANVLNV